MIAIDYRVVFLMFWNGRRAVCHELTRSIVNKLCLRLRLYNLGKYYIVIAKHQEREAGENYGREYQEIWQAIYKNDACKGR